MRHGLYRHQGTEIRNNKTQLLKEPREQTLALTFSLRRVNLCALLLPRRWCPQCPRGDIPCTRWIHNDNKRSSNSIVQVPRDERNGLRN